MAGVVEDRRGARVAGAAAVMGAGAALVVAGLVHSVATWFPFPPIAVAESIIHLAPGGVDTVSIERLGHLAQPLLVVATTATFLAISFGLGRFLPRLERALPGGALPASFLLGLPLTALAVLAEEPNAVTVGRAEYALLLLPALAIGAIVSTWSLRRLGRRPAAEEPVSFAPDPSRRELVRALWVGGAGLAIGWTGLGRLVFRGSDPGGKPLSVRVASPARAPSPASAAFDGITGLSPRLTPVGEFYTVDTELFDPVVNADTWTLSIGGLVDRPFELTYDELLDQPAVEFFSTLECISNPVGGDLISTGRWTGVPVRNLLERAGIRDGVVEVVSTAVDGYADSIPLEEAMGEHAIVAIGLNGSTLPRAHGYPARLLVPGHYGMKQPKWLGSIELVDAPFEGYWEQRGWSKTAIVKTMSRIDAAVPDGGRTTLAGVAFAGTRAISRVEVSTDGGTSWNDAELETPLSSLTWRRWRYAFDTPAQRTVLMVRATDGEGARQTRRVEAPHPSGATGWETISLG